MLRCLAVASQLDHFRVMNSFEEYYNGFYFLRGRSINFRNPRLSLRVMPSVTFLQQLSHLTFSNSRRATIVFN